MRSTLVLMRETAVQLELFSEAAPNGRSHRRAQPTMRLQRLAQLATVDELTGVLNRRGMMQHLEDAARSHRFLVAYVDIDRFKTINDLAGHAHGDTVLCQVADALRTIGVGNTVGRLGGDEFILTVQSTDHPMVIGGRILEAVSEATDGNSVSVGIAHFEPGDSVDDVLGHADLALRKSKERGRHRVTVFDHRLRREMHRRIAVSRELRAAVAERRFDLDIHPIWDVRSGRLAGGECLLRLVTASGERERPQSWLGLAEELGLIAKIDDIALDMAGELLEDLQRNVDPETSLSVNVSPLTVAGGELAGHCERILRRHSINRNTFGIEISEHIRPSDLSGAMAQLHRLREMGVAVLLDDFGAGHASLIQLRDLPLQAVKLDTRFTQGDRSRPASLEWTLRVAQTTVDLVHSLDLDVVFEGIERPEHLDVANRVGARYVQGYHLARPMRIEEYRRAVHDDVRQRGLDRTAVTPRSSRPVASV